MICQKCGRNFPDGNKFCIYCGEKVEIPAVRPQAAEVDGFAAYRALVQTPVQVPVQRPAQTPVQTAAPVQAAAPVHSVPQAVAVQPAAVAPAANNADITETVNTLVYQMQSENRKNKLLILLIGVLITVIAVGVGAFFAFGGMELFAKEKEESSAVEESNVNQGQYTSTPGGEVTDPLTSVPSAQNPDSNLTTTVPNLTEAPTTQHQPAGYVITSSGLTMPERGNTEGICQAYNSAINNVRRYTGSVTLTKLETVDMWANDVPKAIEGAINSIIQNFLGTTENTYVYSNGVDENGGPLGERIIPWGRDASVSAYDVASADIVENPDGGYTITITFVDETTEFDGMNMTEPEHHKTAMDPLNLATLDISPLEITSAEMYYPGATVTLTVDSQGRISDLNNFLPLEGSGECGLGPIKANIGIEGSMDATYTFVY